MFDQMQVSPLAPSSLESHLLSDLLACSDFRDGFEEDAVNEEISQSEDELILFVNHELSTQMYRRGKLFEQLFGGSTLSYVHHIGFVVGYLNQLMATRKLS